MPLDIVLLHLYLVHVEVGYVNKLEFLNRSYTTYLLRIKFELSM